MRVPVNKRSDQGNNFGLKFSTDIFYIEAGVNTVFPLQIPIIVLFQDADQFIFPEGSNHQRGRFEKAFLQIGSSVMIGKGQIPTRCLT